MPTENEEVGKVAWPEASSVPVPSVVVPSMNVTVPLGVPVAGATALTVAMKVTDWPNTDGLAEELTTVVVAFVGPPTAEILVTKASTKPPNVVWKAPGVVGKSIELVNPVT